MNNDEHNEQNKLENIQQKKQPEADNQELKDDISSGISIKQNFENKLNKTKKHKNGNSHSKANSLNTLLNKNNSNNSFGDKGTSINYSKNSNLFLNSNYTNNARHYGYSNLHSANSLQNSSTSVSFGLSKSKRFDKSNQNVVNDILYNIPAIKRSESYSTINFGFGERTNIISTSQNPSPNQYYIKSSTELNKLQNKGFVIGRRLDRPQPSSTYQPGPGQYDGNKWKIIRDIPFTVKSRVAFFYDIDMKQQKHCISPQKYFPSTKTQEITRFNSTSFGKVERFKIDASRECVPGPGTYNLPSIFNKKMRKPPLN